MTIQLPSARTLAALCDRLGIDATQDEVSQYLDLMRPVLEAYRFVDAQPQPLPQVKYLRTPGYQPSAEENPYNAWYWKTAIKGADTGVLAGKRIAIKDDIMVAGVPMMNGAATLEGYTPEIDATLVTRILDAGGEIAGKAHCEYFCCSGGSHTGAKGHVRNPLDPSRSTGGSSSGSAALVAAGDVDMAIGCDQGGSIRMPSSFCGTVGMKPTYGLVPYTGIMPIEVTIDHTGPITSSVADNATLLEVIAGPDDYDPRQEGTVVNPYTKALGQDAEGLRLAVITEGFGHATSEADVDDTVTAAAERFKAMGAEVDMVSLPEHLTAHGAFLPLVTDGLTNTMLYGDGYGASRKDLYVPSLMEAHRPWRARTNEMSANVKLFLMVGTYVQEQHGTRYYAKAANLARVFTAAYDRVLASYDMLLMPTTPMKATPLPAADAPLAELIQRALEPLTNTAPFDMTGHPAIAVPCGMRDGLPVSMMLVGAHNNEMTLYQAAHAFEQSVDWRTL